MKLNAKKMKYRIKKYNLVFGDLREPLLCEQLPSSLCYDAIIYAVQVKKWFCWVTVKEFCDISDEEFARLEAEELLELLNQ